jgi:hypothetical protein
LASVVEVVKIKWRTIITPDDHRHENTEAVGDSGTDLFLKDEAIPEMAIFAIREWGWIWLYA